MPSVPLITMREADAARASAQKVVEIHRRISRWLRPGVTLPEVDRFVAATLEELHCRSCFLGYKIPKSPAFPSHACLSVNDCVVHGTAGYYLQPLRSGDLLKIDIGVTFEGWIGDAAWTYAFGEPSDEAKRLMAAGKESLRLGIQSLRPGGPYIDWARAVQSNIEQKWGFHLIRGLGGHGYGRKLHGPPFISNTVPTYTGEWPDAYSPAKPGTLVALEPMVAVGTGRTAQRKNEWPIFTADSSLSVHYEHDVLMTDSGPVILTAGMEDLKDLIT
jgi:methionyl aminopeptidase